VRKRTGASNALSVTAAVKTVVMCRVIKASGLNDAGMLMRKGMTKRLASNTMVHRRGRKGVAEPSAVRWLIMCIIRI